MSEEKLDVVLAAWEIGRVESGFGARLGGLGVVVEELPAELLRVAARRGVALRLRTLSPCFSWYDRAALEPLDLDLPARIEGQRFSFQGFRRRVAERVETGEGSLTVEHELIYVWDDWQLSWTRPGAIYPEDPWMAAKLYSAVAQAMAAYLGQAPCDTLHLHDYHVGLLPFFLDGALLDRCQAHLTVHNGSYQGRVPLQGGGYETLERLGLPGAPLFHRYFDHFDHLNLLKAAMLRVQELGGRVTTVSGDLEGSWGYAAELRQDLGSLRAAARARTGREPRMPFLPNMGLDAFERLPVAGITNGLSAQARPERLPELRAAHLRALAAARARPLFGHPEVERSMLERDHAFDAGTLEVKAELCRLLHLECFGDEPPEDAALVVAVGRLTPQKHLDLLLAAAEPVLAREPGARFIVLASASDAEGRAQERAFAALAARLPGRFWYGNRFDLPLSRLIVAGGDFALVPSRFEPCGLVDYEASLLGTVVIARRTGGLAKMEPCGYLYDWYDDGDPEGEAQVLGERIAEALRVRREDPAEHRRRVLASMAVDAGWERSAGQYLELYLHGRDSLRWRLERRGMRERFLASLGPDRERFARWFRPALAPWADPLDWELYEALRSQGR